MNFHRTALIRFYDDLTDVGFNSPDRGAHVSAVTGMIGEDLLLGLLFHCVGRHNPPLNCVALPDRCKAPGKKGKRLDAWITIGENRVGQVEIKNWSAHSLGESSLQLNATPEQLAAAAKRRWREFFGENDRMPESTRKVLHDMPVPERVANRSFERWLCFWLPIAETEITPITNAHIMGKEVNVFSASIYLRQLQENLLDLHVPRIEARLQLLASLRADEA